MELPAIDTSLDAPLPQVDPNSDVVPYRLARTDPSGQQVVTTGYGPRARPAIAPPGVGGAGFPDLSQGITQAYQNLPVEQAGKAIEAAIRYQAQRGYMRDLQSGSNAAQAFAKWGPMLFHQATGIPEAIDRSVPTPITPQQLIQNARNQRLDAERVAEFKAKMDAAQAKANTPKLHFGPNGEIVKEKPGGEFEVARPGTVKPAPLSVEKHAELTDAYKELDAARNEMNKLDALPFEDPKVEAAWQKLNSAKLRINRITAPTPTKTVTTAPFKEGTTVRSKKDGKLYKIVNGEPVPVKE